MDTWAKFSFKHDQRMPLEIYFNPKGLIIILIAFRCQALIPNARRTVPNYIAYSQISISYHWIIFVLRITVSSIACITRYTYSRAYSVPYRFKSTICILQYLNYVTFIARLWTVTNHMYSHSQIKSLTCFVANILAGLSLDM